MLINGLLVVDVHIVQTGRLALVMTSKLVSLRLHANGIHLKMVRSSQSNSHQVHHKEFGGNVAKYVEKAKDKKDSFRLMGFGHRVYKNYDPRATVMMQSCHEVLDDLGINDPLLELAMELEKIAREDEYFVERNLYPNVDFYSGIILKAMGFPSSMFTVLFAVARTTGWIAQWKEMVEDPKQKIGRPRQLYTGPTKRDYVPLAKR